MAHLTKPAQYNIEDSNIALLGSDLEKRVREHAGDKEAAWEEAGTTIGLQIWRIEQFHVIEWPKDRHGTFYDGDSYIILQTYKESPDARSFSYHLHFWLGQNTTQDEAGTAAYKSVELDDHLHGTPVQYREVQNYETAQFLSYFPQFTCLRGGVATGFHHITEPPPLDIRKLYRVNSSRSISGRSTLVVREVPAEASSLVEGDVYVLDKGTEIVQFNTKNSAGKERFKAAEFVRALSDERKGKSEVIVYDEGGHGASLFLNEFDAETLLPAPILNQFEGPQMSLFQLSDKTGTPTFTRVTAISHASLLSEDAFLLDDSQDLVQPAIYLWLGRNASLNERRLSLQYAQRYLYQRRQEVNVTQVAIPIIKQEEGRETQSFIQVLAK
ncbi:actin regulatory protein [Macrolepiota fuliginosa MF-IS2]|uniref:Actin regulatory protein n=1 Tax=Macrolepiota fuliginosa MF-IS2 TaxID=1400762 RepID=A0A9P6C9A2_9AGAR|nr:actin regulatory protein [Macrolepiota fuliginosa MF-IS2]